MAGCPDSSSSRPFGRLTCIHVVFGFVGFDVGSDEGSKDVDAFDEEVMLGSEGEDEIDCSCVGCGAVVLFVGRVFLEHTEDY